MTTTEYSHVFLVGNLNGNLKPEQLDTNNWKQEIVSPYGETKRYERDRGYNSLCTLYYKAHIDAMLEAKDVIRPEFLNAVHHFIHDIEKVTENDNNKNCIKLLFEKGSYPKYTPFEYTFRLCRLHLYFFPLNIVLFAIELDDSGTELDNLTASHNKLMGNWDTTSFCNVRLAELMKPLTTYCCQEESNRLTKDGNKLKMFQSIRIKTDKIENDLLYEIGTSSPIGCVKLGKRPDLKPSESYFNKIISENGVSTFDNWKGLALMDSFTMLGKEDSFNENDCNFLYFPLIYLRCIFEKTFCFSRNNAYRENKMEKDLPWEIEQMEKYYFYENISYNFQPNLLYQAMAKGLDIKEERLELSKQIKDRAKDKEEKRRSRITLGISAFAIFSVAWDLCSIYMKAFSSETNRTPAIVLFVLSIFAIAILSLYTYLNKK